MVKPNRGRVNTDPTFQEPPPKLVFGQFMICPTCRGMKKRISKCGACGMTGVVSIGSPKTSSSGATE